MIQLFNLFIQTWLQVVAILKYFSTSGVIVILDLSTDSPKPDGPMSEKVPAKAIELANAEVEAIVRIIITWTQIAIYVHL